MATFVLIHGGVQGGASAHAVNVIAPKELTELLLEVI
jgi:hypothetical protein